ncbi:sensor histidine kinase [Leptospira idonii]|uniref:histidine kinase n=1 Tax=Leptospira idonii TaxID=1193500 RepID=A0A4R9LVJ0_9LEPT|nr:sensor histidine kinase [Leptospira idonii]TGN16922.1 hypothetical protein EHS15_18930 [Leptospira idonii]
MNACKLLSIFFILIGASHCSRYREFSGEVQKGIFDAREWQINSHQILELNGEWEFYWKEWLSPHTESKAKTYLYLPAFWNETTKGEAYGYATYRTKLLLPPNFDSSTELALKLYEADTAYSVYLNGKFLTKIGEPSQDAKTSVPRWEIKTVGFYTNDTELEILIHASNYEHRIGGIWKAPILGKAEDILQISQIRLSYDLFLFGGLWITGCIHLLFYYLRKEEKTLFFFALICLLSAMRPLVSDERFLLTLFPDLSFQTIVRSEYLSYYLVCPLFYQYIYFLFPDIISRKTTHIVTGICLFFSGIVLLTPVSFFSKTLSYYDLIYFLMSMYHLSTFAYHTIFGKREGTRSMLFGMVWIFIFALNDILYFANIIHTSNTIAMGIFIFVFVQTFYLAEKYSKSHRYQIRTKEKLKLLLRESIKRKQKDKLAVVGHFTSEIVHDIRNRLLSLKFTNVNGQEYLKEEIDELKVVTENILDFAKRQFHLKKADTNLSDFLYGLKPEIERTFFPKEIETIYNLRFMGILQLDQTRMKSLILNLARNAKDAISQRGSFKIDTEEEGEFIYMIFSDDGDGMTEDTVNQIQSNQLTSTKTSGHGFGMSSVKRIAEAHKAQILIDSQFGKGTRISIIFPKKYHSKEANR